MNWLITGGCGFIGVNLVARLLAEGGHAIRILDNLSVGQEEDLARVCGFHRVTAANTAFREGGVELVVGDIQDPDLAIVIAQSVDIIVHLAGNTGVAPSVEDPVGDCHANVLGTLNYLEAARHSGVKRFIFASSGAPVGEATPPITEEIVPHPVSPYGASKLAGEAYCSAYNRSYGLETVALRFSNVYGPRSQRKNSVVAKFIKAVFDGAPIEVFGSGEQVRDFIYVDDLTWAIRMAAGASKMGAEVFQIGSGKGYTLNELVEVLSSLVNGRQELAVMKSPPRVGDVMINYVDNSKARKVLGWTPEHVMQAGLKDTLDWYKREYGKKA